MRCIVGFFGMTRSLRHTARSIEESYLVPLRRAGFPLRRAGHFNLPDMIDNPRSGERGIPPDRHESALLDLELCWIEPQLAENIAEHLAIAQAFPDPFGDEYRSIANLCQQLRSLRRLWSMLMLLPLEADDLILLLRPDLFYLDALSPLEDLHPLIAGRVDLIVPRWQHWGGLNDRFAFCNRRGAEVYARRLDDLIDACLAMGGMHSELFLQLVARHHGLRVGFTDLRAVRVRANGQIAGNDSAVLASPAPPLMPAMGQAVS
jgi:hypothetical protein